MRTVGENAVRKLKENPFRFILQLSLEKFQKFERKRRGQMKDYFMSFYVFLSSLCLSIPKKLYLRFFFLVLTYSLISNANKVKNEW